MEADARRQTLEFVSKDLPGEVRTRDFCSKILADLCNTLLPLTPEDFCLQVKSLDVQRSGSGYFDFPVPFTIENGQLVTGSTLLPSQQTFAFQSEDEITRYS